MKLDIENFFGTESRKILASAGAFMKSKSTPESRKKFNGQSTYQIYRTKDGKTIFEGNYNSMLRYLNSVAMLTHNMRKKLIAS
jgi:hypothetical protein